MSETATLVKFGEYRREAADLDRGIIQAINTIRDNTQHKVTFSKTETVQSDRSGGLFAKAEKCKVTTIEIVITETI